MAEFMELMVSPASNSSSCLPPDDSICHLPPALHNTDSDSDDAVDDEARGAGTATIQHESAALLRLRCLMAQENIGKTAATAAIYWNTSDEWLMRFLRARRYNVAAALCSLAAYSRLRLHSTAGGGGVAAGSSSCSITNTGWTRQSPFVSYHCQSGPVRAAISDGLPAVLRERDRHGRTVVVLFADRWRCDDAAAPVHGGQQRRCYTLVHVVRAVLLSLERLLDAPACQLAGFVFIVDGSGCSGRLWRQLLLWPWWQQLASCLAGAFPARISGVHFVHQSWLMTALAALLRRTMPVKLATRVHVHGNDLAALHVHVSRRVLPAELGGDRASYDSQRWASIMLN